MVNGEKCRLRDFTARTGALVSKNSHRLSVPALIGGTVADLPLMPVCLVGDPTISVQPLLVSLVIGPVIGFILLRTGLFVGLPLLFIFVRHRWSRRRRGRGGLLRAGGGRPPAFEQATVIVKSPLNDMLTGNVLQKGLCFNPTPEIPIDVNPSHNCVCHR